MYEYMYVRMYLCICMYSIYIVHMCICKYVLCIYIYIMYVYIVLRKYVCM